MDSYRHPNPAGSDANAAPLLGHANAPCDCDAHGDSLPNADSNANAPPNVDAGAHPHQDPHGDVYDHIYADNRSLPDALCVPGP